LDITANELLKGSKKLPFILVRNFPYGKATKIIGKLGTLGKVLRIDGCKKAEAMQLKDEIHAAIKML
jgi:hypothetical protein